MKNFQQTIFNIIIIIALAGIAILYGINLSKHKVVVTQPQISILIRYKLLKLDQ